MGKWLKKRGLLLLMVVIALLIAILTPIVVNCIFIKQKWATGNDLGNAEWLDFWGGYLGSALGIVPALIALWVSIQQYDRAQKIEAERFRMNILPIISATFTQMQEKDLNSSLPYISEFHAEGDVVLRQPDISEFYALKAMISDDKRLVYKMDLQNVGYGPSSNTHFCIGRLTLPLNYLAVGQTQSFIIVFPHSSSPDSKSFEKPCYIVFKDALGNQYYQEQNIVIYMEYNEQFKTDIDHVSIKSTGEPRLDNDNTGVWATINPS